MIYTHYVIYLIHYFFQERFYLHNINFKYSILISIYNEIFNIQFNSLLYFNLVCKNDCY